MAKKVRKTALVDLAPTAVVDFRKVRRWSEEKFGKSAAIRYQALLEQALRDIQADPELPGSRERPGIMIAGARVYHLAFSRDRVRGAKVQSPRHFILYRRKDADGVIEVARILRDARELSRHLPAAFRPGKSPAN